jgi:hypothetical protein
LIASTVLLLAADFMPCREKERETKARATAA